jgi:hypothetical protein
MMREASSKKGPIPPGKREIEETLGRANVLWTSLHARLAEEFGPLAEKWSFSGKTERWSLQLKREKGKRTVLYMILCRGYLIAAFALGENACRAASESSLSRPVIDVIENAPKYAEGRGVWLDVRTKKDVENVLKLAAIKMAK